MISPTFGRVRRGVVWHVIAAEPAWPGLPDAGTWCGTDERLVETIDLRPPRGARLCRRCCAAVAEFARLVAFVDDATQVRRSPAAPDGGRVDDTTYGGRPVEDVDLVSELIDHSRLANPGVES